LQTSLFAQFCVSATHFPFEGSQHPPVHMFPAQHVCPGAPHVVHEPAVHTWPPWQVAPDPTHAFVAGSQHAPLPHIAPAQHACPGAPQNEHALPTQTSAPLSHEPPLATH
jgi:hypothetical protein